jgi:transketolase N-terminal domain/subunit
MLSWRLQEISGDHTAMSAPDLDQLCVNTIRTLSIDAVQQANSGHPGTSMAMASVVYALWQWHLRFDPNDLAGHPAGGAHGDPGRLHLHP